MNIGTLHVRIARKTVEALNICTFELVNIDGGAPCILCRFAH
jgi:hypothetical protein